MQSHLNCAMRIVLIINFLKRDVVNFILLVEERLRLIWTLYYRESLIARSVMLGKVQDRI
jgi:hypothetical protein